MKFLVRGLMLASAVFVICLIYFGFSAILHARPVASFNNGGNDLSSRVDSLRQQLGYVQSKLGITFYDFDFAVPAGKKLVATFVAKLDDKLVPDMSGVFHIPTTDEAPDKKGNLSMVFFHPKYESLSEQSSICEIIFRVPKANQGYTMSLPFNPSSAAGGSSMTEGSSGLSSLEDGKDYQVWHMMAEGRDKSGQPSYVFKYSLSVRLEKLAEGETLDGINRDDLPAPQ